MISFNKKMEEYLNEVTKSLNGYLPEKRGFLYNSEIIAEAVEYSLSAGGKRLRPIILLSSADAFGSAVNAIPFAAAIEMIHTYSLIHDDLPAMDDDDYRRGKPSCHKRFGEAYGILAGDALLNMAFEVMLKEISAANSKSMAVYAKAASIIGEASGINGMIAGQTTDIYWENKSVDEKALIYINERKTGALISAAYEAGALLGGATESECKCFKQAGMKTGIAFQIKDDILDYEGSFEKLGKMTGSDAKNNKSTYVTVMGMENCKKRIEQLTQEAIGLLKSTAGETEFIISLTESLINRAN